MTTTIDRSPTRVVRGGRGPAGLGLRPWQTKTAAYTAKSGDRLVVDSTDGAFTVTLPSGGGELWISSVGDTLSTHTVTLAGNGKTIDGAATLALDGDAAGYLIHLISQDDTWLYDLTFQHGAA